MKVHGFVFESENGADFNLSSLLEKVGSLPLEERSDGDRTYDYCRLEEAIKAEGGWNLRFMRGRFDGQGKCSPKTPVSDIGLAREEAFAEESFAYYNDSTRVFMFGVNYRGARINSVEALLGRLCKNLLSGGVHKGNENIKFFHFIPVLKGGAFEKLRSSKYISKLELRVKPEMLTREDAAGLSIVSLLQRVSGPGVETINYTISSSKDGYLATSIKDHILALFPFAGKRQAVRKLKIECDGQFIDLIEQRVVEEIDVKRATQANRRYDSELMWRSLKAFHDQWLKNDIIWSIPTLE